jgi:hypothetical protein
MNCNHIHEQLPDLLYDELSPGTRDQVKEHLSQCPACKSEYASLKDLHGLLDGVRPPAVSVNVSGILRKAMAIQGRGTRRWRRAALALAGIAATVLAVTLFRLEIRAGSHQLVIRCGNSTSETEPHTKDKIAQSESTSPEVSSFAAKEAELQPLRGVIYELAAGMDQLSRDLENRDQRQQQNVARLQEQLTQLRVIVQRQVATYLADSSHKGDNR